MTAHAPFSERPAWVPQDLYPFESRYAHVAGARVHYVDEGSGPPLLLLHGNPTWSFLYRDVSPDCVSASAASRPTCRASACPARRRATASRRPSTPT